MFHASDQNMCQTVGVMFVLMFLTGCEGLEVSLPEPGPKVTPPTVKVIGLTLGEQTGVGTRLHVIVQLENPNDFSLSLVKSRYTFDVGAAGTGGSIDKPNRTLPANGRQTVQLPVAVPVTADAIRGATWRTGGSIIYEPPGEFRRLLTESGFALPAVQFAGEGVVE